MSPTPEIHNLRNVTGTTLPRMDPAVIGTRLASGVVAPLIKKLFAREGPGAGLVDRPVRLSALVSFRGEKRTLDEKDFRRLVRELARRAARETGERPMGAIELEALTDALERAQGPLPRRRSVRGDRARPTAWRGRLRQDHPGAVAGGHHRPPGPAHGDLAHLIGRVPYVLPLRTLTRGGASLPTPGDFLSAVGNPLAGSQPTGWTDRVLSAGRGLLLIDDIDEVPEEERERTRRRFSDLLTAFPGNLWLVTSRPSAVREDWLGGEDFTDLTLSRMSRENITASSAAGTRRPGPTRRPPPVRTAAPRPHPAARPPPAGAGDGGAGSRHDRRLPTTRLPAADRRRPPRRTQIGQELTY
ncbi:hypothetical protein GCM10010449_53070 [Streptomyces rectiviolaceus]|uniref:NACHT domain-containing protein n=1 Tax=Streptomyces rectiviolaceus TaxID=332591 RepID=A0ABP6MSS5_9ACTN